MTRCWIPALNIIIKILISSEICCSFIQKFLSRMKGTKIASGHSGNLRGRISRRWGWSWSIKSASWKRSSFFLRLIFLDSFSFSIFITGLEKIWKKIGAKLDWLVTLVKAQDLLLFQKFDRSLFYIYWQIFEWSANLGPYPDLRTSVYLSSVVYSTNLIRSLLKL